MYTYKSENLLMKRLQLKKMSEDEVQIDFCDQEILAKV